MEAFFTSTAAVALAEVGDKTQLLSLVLAAQLRRPWPLIAGILLATIINHGLAGALGAAVGDWLGPELLRWIVGLGFLAMAAWTLRPDEAGDDPDASRHGPFLTALVAFFLAEMGDKTQIATVGLAAAFPGRLTGVVLGTTLGMMIANVPVVLLGEKIAAAFDLSRVRFVAAALFGLFGVWVLAFGPG